MLLNGSRYDIKEEKNGFKVYMAMLIRSFSTKDVGTYNCISTNSLGRAEGTLRLYEIKITHGGTSEYVGIVGGVAESARSHIARDNNSASTMYLPPSFLMSISACLVIILLNR